MDTIWYGLPGLFFATCFVLAGYDYRVGLLPARSAAAPARPPANLAVSDTAAGDSTPRLLSWLVLPLLPALLGFPAMCWWAFRERIDGRTPVSW